MRNLIISLALAVCSAFSAGAQRTAADFFQSAPLDVMPLISQNTRLDMLDYFRAGSAIATTNEAGGRSRLLSVADETLTCQLSDSVTMQIAVVSLAPSDSIICLIETMHLPMAESRVRFFNTDWSQTSRTPLEMPGIVQWVPDKVARAKVREQLPFITAKWQYLPETHTLEAVPTIRDYYHPSDVPEAVALLPDKLQYVWNGKTFKPAK